jgi:hypothetical protein
MARAATRARAGHGISNGTDKGKGDSNSSATQQLEVGYGGEGVYWKPVDI